MKNQYQAKFSQFFFLIMLIFTGCGATNTSDNNQNFSASENTDNVVSSNLIMDNQSSASSYYPISFIGDAFRYNRGLASVVLQNGDVCVINESGIPLVVVSDTYYSKHEENELSIPDYISNGCFVFSISYTDDISGKYVFSHDGTLLKNLTVGTNTECDALAAYYYNTDAFYWLSMEGNFDTVSYVLNRMDANGNTSTQVLTEGEEVHNYLSADSSEETTLEIMEEKIKENSDLNAASCFVKDDGSAIIICYGMDGKPYYAYASQEGVLTSELVKLDADYAFFCGQNILLLHMHPEIDENYAEFSMLDTQTANITDLNFGGLIDGTNSRYALRPFAETGEKLQTGQIRRTNFICPDGTLLFQKDSFGNTVIEIPDSVPRY